MEALSGQLEAERGLQIDASNSSTSRERPSLHTIWDVEVRRPKNAAGISKIHFVKDVPHVRAQREIVAAVGTRPAHLRSPSVQRSTVVVTTTASAPSPGI